MQFEKIGHGLLQEGLPSNGVCGELKERGKKKPMVLENSNTQATQVIGRTC